MTCSFLPAMLDPLDPGSPAQYSALDRE